MTSRIKGGKGEMVNFQEKKKKKIGAKLKITVLDEKFQQYLLISPSFFIFLLLVAHIRFSLKG